LLLVDAHAPIDKGLFMEHPIMLAEFV